MAQERPFKRFPPHKPRPAGAETPLQGLRVVDFTHFVAGPFCTMMLGDLGADVIKIEGVRGDDFRHYPPAEPDLGGEGAPFLWTNRNKRSITLNLKSEAGLSVARALIAQADIVVENFSTGVMERLGLGYDVLSRDRPELIYCSVSAYGRTGAFADRLGFDPVIQAESGFISMNGYADRDGVRAQSIIMDTSTGIMACNAVLAAVVARDRTGKGQRVDLSLYDTAMSMIGFATMQYLLSGVVPQRNGNTSNDTSPTGVFHAKDTPFYISCSSTAIFQRLFRAIGRPDVAEDPDLQDRGGRLRRREELFAILDAAFAQEVWAHWGPLLREAGVAAGEVRSLPDALNSDVTRESGLVTRIPHPTAGEIPNLALPFHFSATPVADPVAAPSIGQHSREVLEDVLGFSAKNIAALSEAGAFGALSAQRPEADARETVIATA
ncbi:CaiB/BaiF CoA transferase family protein [Brevundimonas diminuta]|uniref:CaiB/BaiF CoA transferase family protein n=1 Tax=Brevundimonas diminuta TaxID=293 RepID=UPI003D9A129C